MLREGRTEDLPRYGVRLVEERHYAHHSSYIVEWDGQDYMVKVRNEECS